MSLWRAMRRRNAGCVKWPLAKAGNCSMPKARVLSSAGVARRRADAGVYSAARRPAVQREAIAARSWNRLRTRPRVMRCWPVKVRRARRKGRTICSCFGVGENTIRAAIRAGCDSAGKLGDTLRCGTNCGSCIPELKALLAQTASLPEAANQTGGGERVAFEFREEFLTRQAGREIGR